MRTHQSRKHITALTPGRKQSHHLSKGNQPGVPHPHPVLQNSLIQRMAPCPCDGGCPRCATQVPGDLTIGQPGDAYEQEADQVAEQVMRMPEPLVQRQPMEEEEEELQAKPLDGQITPLVQRQCCGEEEEELMAKPLDGQINPLIQTQCCGEEEEAVQSQPSGRQNPQQSIGSKVRTHAGNCPGKALHDSTQNFFEPRFDRDFGDVRVHTCDSAVQMNKELSAQAFTYGNNIFFNSGKYNPESFEGKRLLGHELTHVLQQNNISIQKKKNHPDFRPHLGEDQGPDPLKDYQGSGSAWCDTSTGRMRTEVTEHCSGNCVRQHENVHVGNRALCCRRVHRCLGLAGENEERRAACMSAYDTWFPQLSDWTECNAYRLEYRCLNSLINNGCGDEGEISAECCTTLRNERTFAHDSRQRHCAAKRFVRCPIDSEGSIR